MGFDHDLAECEGFRKTKTMADFFPLSIYKPLITNVDKSVAFWPSWLGQTLSLLYTSRTPENLLVIYISDKSSTNICFRDKKE